MNKPVLALAGDDAALIRAAGGLAAGDYKPSIVLPPEASPWFQQNHPAFESSRLFFFVSPRQVPNASGRWKIGARYVRGCGLRGQSILISGLPKDQEMVRRLVREVPGTVSVSAEGFFCTLPPPQGRATRADGGYGHRPRLRRARQTARGFLQPGRSAHRLHQSSPPAPAGLSPAEPAASFPTLIRRKPSPRRATTGLRIHSNFFFSARPKTKSRQRREAITYMMLPGRERAVCR